MTRPFKYRPEATPVSPTAPAEALGLERDQAPPEKILADRRLVDRCLSGDPMGWSDLYERFHERLRSSTRSILGRLGGDASLVDEVAARVWYSLVRNEFELLARFDVQRGCRLSTFFSVLAKNEARQLLRSERRRKTREFGAAKQEPSIHSDTLSDISNDEFLASLTPAELTFYRETVLMEAPVDTRGIDANGAYSRTNTWQLTHRVRKKLCRFLGIE